MKKVFMNRGHNSIGKDLSVFKTVVFLFFILFVSWHASIANSAILTYPGPAPCNTTLQACINSAANGDIVEIATNSTISESITIDKSLTLKQATGYSPVLSGYLLLGTAATPTNIEVAGLTINGTIRGAPGTGDLTLKIVNNTVNINSSYGVGIDISSGSFPPYGNVVATIEGNTVNVTGGGHGSQCGGIHMGLIDDSGTFQGFIRNNRVNVNGCGQGDAIMAVPGPGETMNVDIIGNIVNATNTNDGIMVRNFFDASQFSLINARVINNVVWGQLNEAGVPGAIVISADGGQQVNAQVINNTVIQNENGIIVSARADLGATITGILSNNIVSSNSVLGISIDSDVASTFTNRYNLVFSNGSNFFSPGVGTLTINPMFVSSTDFHLQQTSPAINSGNNTDVPSDITIDLDGNQRIFGARVDMGAYEYQGQPALVSVPSMTEWGMIIFMVLAGTGALYYLRKE